MNDTNAQISILCLSKNRPLQLEAYLTSLFQMCREPCSVSVLYTCDLAFSASYEKLRNEFSKVNFLSETQFSRQISDIVRKTKTPLFMFGCDDVVFKGSWEPSKIMAKFRGASGLLAFSLRLGREITYCYPIDRDMSLPDFHEEKPFLVWRWLNAEADWGYPWELDCTVYPINFVKDFLRKFEGHFRRRKLDWSNPNRLEALGAGLIGQEKGLDLMAAYPEARASVLTVNKVQDDFPNRVYESNFTAKELLDMWNRGVVLNTRYYVGRSYKSIHIGDAQFAHRSERQQIPTPRSLPNGRSVPSPV